MNIDVLQLVLWPFIVSPRGRVRPMACGRVDHCKATLVKFVSNRRVHAYMHHLNSLRQCGCAREVDKGPPTRLENISHEAFLLVDPVWTSLLHNTSNTACHLFVIRTVRWAFSPNRERPFVGHIFVVHREANTHTAAGSEQARACSASCPLTP